MRPDATLSVRVQHTGIRKNTRRRVPLSLLRKNDRDGLWQSPDPNVLHKKKHDEPSRSSGSRTPMDNSESCCHADRPGTSQRWGSGVASWDVAADGGDVAALRTQLLELTGDVAMVVALQRYPSVFKVAMSHASKIVLLAGLQFRSHHHHVFTLPGSCQAASTS